MLTAVGVLMEVLERGGYPKLKNHLEFSVSHQPNPAENGNDSYTQVPNPMFDQARQEFQDEFPSITMHHVTPGAAV